MLKYFRNIYKIENSSVLPFDICLRRWSINPNCFSSLPRLFSSSVFGLLFSSLQLRIIKILPDYLQSGLIQKTTDVTMKNC